MKKYLPFVIIALVLAVAAGASFWLYRSQQQQPQSASPTAPLSVRNNPLPGAEPPRMKGDPNAPVTVEEFGDFECPPCAATYPILKRVEAAHAGRVRIVFRHFPLPSIHRNAVAAAAAAEAAASQGRFWEMHDMLYENQREWAGKDNAQTTFADYARQLGLDLERFTRDMNSPQTLERIRADASRGNSLGVTGTPTIFINGRELSANEISFEGISAAIGRAAAAGGQR